MLLNWLINWRTRLFLGLFVLVALSNFVPQTEGHLPAGWWIEQQREGLPGWQVSRRAVTLSKRWLRVYRTYRWGRAGMWLALSLWLWGHLLAQFAPTWLWVSVIATSYLAVKESHQVLVGWTTVPLIQGGHISVPSPAAGSESAVEVTVDLAPLLADLGDWSPSDDVSLTARETLTARLERIRAECFQHPVSQALMEQIAAEVQQVVKRLVEDEYLGFGRYERTGAAKPAHPYRSGSWGRTLRTMWSLTVVRVPKLRRGNQERVWRVLERYERSFGPWLDLQLHLYLLGLSQHDLPEILHLSFGQVLSVKAIEHLSAVARQEMEAFHQARLKDSPPVILVDGVNLQILLPSGTHRLNQRGQRREVKRRESRVLLAALGVWAEGRYRLLHFETVAQETKDSWRKFFEHLVTKGLDKSQLQLVVTDGRPGFPQAIGAVFPKTVKHQRCIFHKLKNLADNLAYKHLTLNPYTGSDIAVMQQRLADFQQRWAALEPKAVRCFVKDFDLTLNYLRVPFPHKRLIRTTNLLERFFREFRSRADEIGCFGSQAQAETLFYLVLRREKAKHAIA